MAERTSNTPTTLSGTLMSDPNTEFVDINHPYVTDHKEGDFVWGFDSAKALDWGAVIIGTIIAHAEHGGPQHAVDQMAIQSGITLEALPKGTQLPVLMMMHEREDGDQGFTPIAILLVPNDRIVDIAHTMGSLVDDSGVHPALPSRMSDEFYHPTFPDEAPEPTPPTTVFDILAQQREDEGV